MMAFTLALHRKSLGPGLRRGDKILVCKVDVVGDDATLLRGPLQAIPP
ncbi:hypothetical protein ACQQ2N_19345 [Dokdonella sp. MW10]